MAAKGETHMEEGRQRRPWSRGPQGSPGSATRPYSRLRERATGERQLRHDDSHLLRLKCTDAFTSSFLSQTERAPINRTWVSITSEFGGSHISQSRFHGLHNEAPPASHLKDRFKTNIAK